MIAVAKNISPRFPQGVYPWMERGKPVSIRGKFEDSGNPGNCDHLLRSPLRQQNGQMDFCCGTMNLHVPVGKHGVCGSLEDVTEMSWEMPQ
ncbi:hypothetical protein JTB14_034597 [Gonioctena quinquepunctata]|nr:hypothetical protein JTB14_034597 [Gonioctena quinquepunctata]